MPQTPAPAPPRKWPYRVAVAVPTCLGWTCGFLLMVDFGAHVDGPGVGFGEELTKAIGVLGVSSILASLVGGIHWKWARWTGWLAGFGVFVAIVAAQVPIRLLHAAFAKKFDNVMLSTTLSDGALHSRPMAVAEVDEQCTMWFVTSTDTAKVAEANADARGAVNAQDGHLFLSMSGALSIVHDRARIEAMWKPAWEVWFPNGKDDPTITLMRFAPQAAEYWDNTGVKGVRYLFEAAEALLKGERPQPSDKDQHAKVSL